jgi:hypothetical protein
LRHAINMSISEGNIERTIELMEELSNSNQDLTFSPRTKEQLDQIVPLLNSREDMLAFLSSNVEQYSSGGVNSVWAADLFWAAYLGDYDLAETILDMGTSVDDGSDLFDSTWFNYPIINPLQNSDAYKRLVKSIKLDEFWRKNGFPKNCRATGDDDFVCN